LNNQCHTKTLNLHREISGEARDGNGSIGRLELFEKMELSQTRF